MKWVVIAAIAVLLAGAIFVVVRRRGAAHALPPLTAAQVELRESLRRDVAALAAIGDRHVHAPGNLAAAAAYIERALAPLPVVRQEYDVATAGARAANLIVEVRGTSRPDEIVVIGAHYDTVDGTPGADDNASGVAGLIALARRFGTATPERTIRFVAFANEEPPHFQTREMGSWIHAKRAHERGERIVAMVSIEMIGYFDTRRGSQQYPRVLAPFYPDRGDFVAVVGNLRSRGLVRRAARAFRRAGTIPVESAAVPELIPHIGWSDQWSFWQFDWPAIMVTDTALFRNPHYHMRTDLPETLDHDRMVRVVDGLSAVIDDLGNR